MNTHLRENEDKDHSDEESWLLGSSTNSGVSDDSDGVSSSKTAKSAGESSGQVSESLVQVISGRSGSDLSLENHSHDQSVDTDDTCYSDYII